jgi:membrane peptidoglycan carboxypeptidase
MRAHRARQIFTAAAAFAVLSSACSLPRVTRGPLGIPSLPQTSVLYDDHGQAITSLHAEQNRTLVPLRRIAGSMRDATIAIEDQRFYDDRGIEPRDTKRLPRS